MTTCHKCGEADIPGDNRQWKRTVLGYEHALCKTWTSDDTMYIAQSNQAGKKSFQSHLNEYLTEVGSYNFRPPAFPLYNKPEPITPDRPTLAQRLDAMEEKYKKECAFKRQLEHDYGILQDKYTKLERDNKIACERVVYVGTRLQGLDLMGRDLQKLRTAIGAKAYNEILNAKDENCAAPF